MFLHWSDRHSTSVDGGAGNDTLVGTNVAQTWEHSVERTAETFQVRPTAFASVRPFAAAQPLLVRLLSGRQYAQTVDGNLGLDTLDNTAISGHVINRPGQAHLTAPGNGNRDRHRL